MATKFVKFGSVTGVLAEAYRNRTDLQKYDLALAKGKNWFVDYKGGLSSRPGTEFYDFIMNDDKNVKLIPFQYSFDLANTYMVMFGHNYIRFVQDGAYVVETAKAVTSIGVDGIITSVGHGFFVGDWVKSADFGLPGVDGQTYIVSAKTANTFQLTDVFGTPVIITGWTSGGTFSRIYTLTTTFNSAKIPDITGHLVRDTLRIISSDQDFLPYNLTRAGHTNWTLTKETFNNTVTVPTNLTGSGDTGSGSTAEVMFVVTAVDENGQESLSSTPLFISGIRDYTVTSGYAKLEWDGIDNIKYYNVYRSIVGRAGQITAAQSVGFLGRAYGPTFIDNNIVPDFTTTPPQSVNPFANSGIKFINITNGGAGYTNASTVSVTDADGTGFRGYPVVSTTGELLAIVVTGAGKNYTAPVVNVTIGAGATFSVELTESTGNNPSSGCIFQQRQIYAGTYNAPLEVIGSKIGLFSNFDVSSIIVENDSYNFDVDSEVVARIKHLVPTRAGLLITSAVGLWNLTGTNGEAVTAIDATAESQSYTGISDLSPLKINEDLAILDSEYKSVRLLAYSDYQKNYVSNDISILSNHYFSDENPLTSWAYFGAPHRTILGTQADGRMVVGCIVKEHEVFGWTDWETQGYILQVEKLREETFDHAYLIVEREINGLTKKYLEGFARRQVSDLELYVGSDAALSLGGTETTTGVRLSGLSGTITLTSFAAAFNSGMVGWRWRGGGGRGTVTAYTDNKTITIQLDTPVTKVVPGTARPAILHQGDWTVDQPVSVLYGLSHLEGETVSCLIDGTVYTEYVVTNGQIDLGDLECTRAVVGLRFDCVGQGLPISDGQSGLEYTRKRICGIGTWEKETRGLKVGTTEDHTYETTFRTDENYNQYTRLHTGISITSVEPEWTIEDTFFFVQSDPLPASLLGFVVEVDLGEN